MTRSDYVIYFNNKTPEGFRKINNKALVCFEKEQSHQEPYYMHTQLWEKIHEWIGSKSEHEWTKIHGKKASKSFIRRIVSPYDFCVRQVRVFEQEGDGYSLAPFGEKIIGKSLNKIYRSYKEDKFTYFSKELMLKEFLDTEPEEISTKKVKSEKQKIIKLMEKYGGSFI
jgi:hypothetical protein